MRMAQAAVGWGVSLIYYGLLLTLGTFLLIMVGAFCAERLVACRLRTASGSGYAHGNLWKVNVHRGTREVWTKLCRIGDIG